MPLNQGRREQQGPGLRDAMPCYREERGFKGITRRSLLVPPHHAESGHLGPPLSGKKVLSWEGRRYPVNLVIQKGMVMPSRADEKNDGSRDGQLSRVMEEEEEEGEDSIATTDTLL